MTATFEAGTDLDCGNNLDRASVARALLMHNTTENMMDARISNLLLT